LAEQAYRRIREYLQAELSLESDIDIMNSPRPLDGAMVNMLCLQPPMEWLPSPMNIEEIDWPNTFRVLENADLTTFGQQVNEPPDL
jgi:hypothetical protein